MVPMRTPRLLAFLMAATALMVSSSLSAQNGPPPSLSITALDSGIDLDGILNDFEGAIDVWADDAVMLPPDLPLLSGKSAISEYVAGAASIPGFKIS